MSVCTATKRNGEPCTLPSRGSEKLCWAHSPATQAKRRRGQSKGGRSKPSTEVKEIKQALKELAEGILEGSVDHSKGAVASQVYNVYLRALKTELDIREQLELVQRLESLEELMESQKQGAYGA